MNDWNALIAEVLPHGWSISQPRRYVTRGGKERFVITARAGAHVSSTLRMWSYRSVSGRGPTPVAAAAQLIRNALRMREHALWDRNNALWKLIANDQPQPGLTATLATPAVTKRTG